MRMGRGHFEFSSKKCRVLCIFFREKTKPGGTRGLIHPRGMVAGRPGQGVQLTPKMFGVEVRIRNFIRRLCHARQNQHTVLHDKTFDF